MSQFPVSDDEFSYIKIFGQLFIENHSSNNNEKFKIGEKVRYIGCWKRYFYKEFIVKAVNRQGEEGVEYLIEGFPYLVYEEELEKI